MAALLPQGPHLRHPGQEVEVGQGRLQQGGLRLPEKDHSARPAAQGRGQAQRCHAPHPLGLVPLPQGARKQDARAQQEHPGKRQGGDTIGGHIPHRGGADQNHRQPPGQSEQGRRQAAPPAGHGGGAVLPGGLPPLAQPQGHPPQPGQAPQPPQGQKEQERQHHMDGGRPHQGGHGPELTGLGDDVEQIDAHHQQGQRDPLDHPPHHLVPEPLVLQLPVGLDGGRARRGLVQVPVGQLHPVLPPGLGEQLLVVHPLRILDVVAPVQAVAHRHVGGHKHRQEAHPDLLQPPPLGRPAVQLRLRRLHIHHRIGKQRKPPLHDSSPFIIRSQSAACCRIRWYSASRACSPASVIW